METLSKIATKTVEILGTVFGAWFVIALVLLAFGLATGGAIWSIKWVFTLLGVIA